MQASLGRRRGTERLARWRGHHSRAEPGDGGDPLRAASVTLMRVIFSSLASGFYCKRSQGRSLEPREGDTAGRRPPKNVCPQARSQAWGGSRKAPLGALQRPALAWDRGWRRASACTCVRACGCACARECARVCGACGCECGSMCTCEKVCVCLCVRASVSVSSCVHCAICPRGHECALHVEHPCVCKRGRVIARACGCVPCA